MAKTEFTCTDCGLTHPDGDLHVVGQRWMCTQCAEEFVAYRATLDAEAADQLAIMAAERGCDREAEWDGCEECPHRPGCVGHARTLALAQRELIAKGGV